MLPVNRFALKEWASVCAALARGRQSLLLRKGGIAEESDGFQVEHREFWLYPTRFHQSPDELRPDAADLPDDPFATSPPPGAVQLSVYGVVEEVLHVESAARLGAFNDLHVLAPATVLKRFEYREPGLKVLLVRAYRCETPFEISESPHFAGCKSWVDLRNKLPTGGLSPVLDDAAFSAVAANVRGRLQDA